MMLGPRPDFHTGLAGTINEAEDASNFFNIEAEFASTQNKTEPFADMRQYAKNKFLMG